MQITNSNIVSEIGSKLARLKSHPHGPFTNGNCRKACLNHEAVCHSLRIENPTSNGGKFHRGREKDRLFNHMLSAFYWGKAEIFGKSITEGAIKELAARIDPEYHSRSASYRGVTEAVRPSGASWTPTYPDKIPLEMGRYVKELNGGINLDLHSLIDTSSYAHLHLVRIHPFSDTNGRTSRMMQNLILDKVGIPSPTIYEGERFHYFQLLDDAINGWRVRTGDRSAVASREEKAFYNFMAGKMSATLDKALEGH